MGLAASQARFLGITLRKANCEFKSTEVAQERLELTRQMTDISQEYSNALNSTKLVWYNDAAADSYGNPSAFGLSYSLLMMPSAANDYNPYMVTSRSGAIILNSKYAQAARDAGISMAGGVPSQKGRDLFIASLANAKIVDGKILASNDSDASVDHLVYGADGRLTNINDGTKISYNGGNDNIITSTTLELLLGTRTVDETADVSWHYAAGMGAVPKDKAASNALTLVDLLNDPDIGGRKIDWLQIYKSALNLDSSITEVEKEEKLDYYQRQISYAKNDYEYEYSGYDHEYFEDIELLAKENALNLFSDSGAVTLGSFYSGNRLEQDYGFPTGFSSLGASKFIYDVLNEFKRLEDLINLEADDATKKMYQNQLEALKKGREQDPDDRTRIRPINDNDESLYLYPLLWQCYEYGKVDYAFSQNELKFTTAADTATAQELSFDQLFYITKSEIGGGGSPGNKGIDLTGVVSDPEKRKLDYLNILTLCVDDTIRNNYTEIQSMTIADLLRDNVVLMAQKTGDHNGGLDQLATLEVASQALMKSIAEAFGYGSIGKGINIDSDTDAALEYAMNMVTKKVLRAGNAITTGSDDSDNALLANSAYRNANDYNRLTDYSDYSGINLSNMLSAFLTYYDNYLRGTDSPFVVGKSNDAGDDYARTTFVTDDPSYVYLTSPSDEISNDEIIADFYNQLYNNICEHGWRQDEMVLDHEYLESAVKDGRYQLMALNNDGYYYQMRYNDVGYLVEEQDKDAIARAEAAFTTKKAQITYKEDQLDVKTKKLDAEITALNTEINSVQNIISKAIEKTFTMFST